MASSSSTTALAAPSSSAAAGVPTTPAAAAAGGAASHRSAAPVISLSQSTLWWLGAAATAAVTGLVSYVMITESRARRAAHDKRKLRRLLHSKFDTRETEILRYIFDSPWNYFTLPKLREIYEKFSAQLARKSDGSMSRVEFHRMHKRIGVDDDQIVDALFRYWDQNTDSSVDFVELVEGLNTALFGSTEARLLRLFRVFDIDDNKSISGNELRQMLRAFAEFKDPKQLDQYVYDVMRAADANHDAKLSLREFQSLASKPGFPLGVLLTFNHKFMEQFGVSRDTKSQ